MQEVYLYQTLHVLDGRCGGLGEHLAVLDRWSRELYGRQFAPHFGELAAGIAALTAREMPAGCDRSAFVRLVVPDPSEKPYRLEFAGVSLYRGYDLRSLRPEAVTLQYDTPLPEAPTSAREAAAQLARKRAQRAGAAVAVRCDADGIALTADDAPLFAVRAKRVFTSPAGASAERMLAMRGIRAAGLEVEERPLEREALSRYDELFYVDHRGLTALARCDGEPMMAILAERIAGALGELFLKK